MRVIGGACRSCQDIVMMLLTCVLLFTTSTLLSSAINTIVVPSCTPGYSAAMEETENSDLTAENCTTSKLFSEPSKIPTEFYGYLSFHNNPLRITETGKYVTVCQEQ